MHLMIDLETLSTDPRATILSAGAVLFNRDRIYGEFYRELDIDAQIRDGRHVMARTVAWWATQGDDAQRVFSDVGEKQPLEKMLQDLTAFVGDAAGDVQVWACGASFDIPILNTAYNDARLPAPWRFYNERCFRTLKWLYGARVSEPKRIGTHHDALADARHQARWAQEIMQCAAL